MTRTCPRYIIALLKDLEDELARAQWNVNQEEYDSPFQNTSNEFKTDTFEVKAYYWGDDEEEIDKPNFKCKDVEIIWYKRLGRGTYINKRVSRRKMEKLYLKCLISIENWEREHDDSPYRTPLSPKEEYKYLKGNRRCKPSLIRRFRIWWAIKHWHDDEESS